MDINKALEIATKAHYGQVRKNGEDYINHCIRVSNMCAKYSSLAAIVGVLHDILEDTKITIADLQYSGCSNDVIMALSIVTRLKSESYLEYILTIKNFDNFSVRDIAMVVKVSDLKDNLKGAKGTLKDKYIMAYYILTGDVYKEE